MDDKIYTLTEEEKNEFYRFLEFNKDQKREYTYEIGKIETLKRGKIGLEIGKIGTKNRISWQESSILPILPLFF